MKVVELVVLLPCHGLEDFPLHHQGAEAESLLAAWTALWHPALIAAAGASPRWYRVDAPPADVAGRLIVLPSVGQDRLPAGFVDRCKTGGAVLIRRFKDRAELVKTALSHLEPEAPAVSAELAADFLALGYARLQTELLASRMHSVGNLDDIYLDQRAVAAAQAAVAGNTTAAREELGRYFAALHESRKFYYPLDVFLLDITLLADTTLGESLRRELGQSQTINLLTTTKLVTRIAEQQPATWAALSAALSARTACLAGGEVEERELPLLPIEAVLSDLKTGAEQLAESIGQRPTIYGRRRYGLCTTLPQILVKLGFQGAIHCTLDDGRFPLGRQGKIRWEGPDASVIDALARVPSDAAAPGTFLALAEKMAESMEVDHIATLALAHWPSVASPWLEDLRRIAGYSPVLGKFVRLDEYFAETALPPIYSRFKADDYRSPYLLQSVIRKQPNPITRFMAEHERQAKTDAIAALRLLTAIIKPTPKGGAGEAYAANTVDEHNRELTAALEGFAAAAPRAAGLPASGLLVVNPLSFSRQVAVEWPASSGLPTVSGAVAAVAASGDRAAAAVDVPAMGYAWIALNAPGATALKRERAVASEATLANEHLTVSISPNTGGIQSIQLAGHRGNRLSQRLALRMPGEPPAPGEPWRDPDESATYTTMVADTVQVTNAGAVLGEISSAGGLVDAQGRRVAGFRQKTQLAVGSRVVRIEIELDPQEPLRPDPWNSYYAARFAWHEPTSRLFRGVHLGRTETEAQRLEAPEYVEIVDDVGSVALLTGGLPFHRRVGDRALDSLLVVRGETARRFVMAVALDAPHPHTAALELLAPPLVFFDAARPPIAPATGWMFHLDSRALLATHWTPLFHRPEDGSAPAIDPPPPAGALIGFRVRLLETSGRAGRCALRAPRPLTAARRVDFLGQPIAAPAIEADRITIDYGAHEWLEIEGWWA